MNNPWNTQVVQDLDATYTWDNQGRMTSMGIPLGSTYQYQYDAMSNLSAITQHACQWWGDDGTCGNWVDNTLASAQYNWAGMRTSLSYLGFNESRTYNNLLQLTRLTAAATTGTALDMEYIYQAGQNNGRIVQSIDHVLGETVNYSYDSLNRLLSAEEASGKWANAFSYDGWGNINGQTWTPGQAAAPGTMSRGTADANGNLIGQPGWVFLWDVENRMVAEPNNMAPTINGVTAGGWGYDPWGKRVSETGFTDLNGGSVSVYTFYGIDGQRLGRYQLTTNDDGTYVFAALTTNMYFGGTLIQANGVTVATDRLGSVRANANGEQFAYYPYVRERQLPPGNTITPHGREKFGTYFRDSENAFGQDYAGQRYYDPYNGWFWSADPGGMATANPRNPTSWNRFAYANNDPVNFSDPTGLNVYAGSDIALPAWYCEMVGGCGGGGGGGDGGGGDPCSGSYFDPNPNPSCYAPVAAPLPAPKRDHRYYFLAVTTDCYDVPTNGGPVTREIDYQLEFMGPGMPKPMGYSHATIWEHLSGAIPVSGPNSPSSGPPGTFYDTQSIVLGYAVQNVTQPFSAALANGTSYGLPVTGFGGTSVTVPGRGTLGMSSQLDITKYAGYVSINGNTGGQVNTNGTLVSGTYTPCN